MDVLSVSDEQGRQRARWLHCMEEGLGQQTSFETGVNARPPSASLARSLAAAACKQSCCGAECRSDAGSERAVPPPAHLPPDKEGSVLFRNTHQVPNPDWSRARDGSRFDFFIPVSGWPLSLASKGPPCPPPRPRPSPWLCSF